MQARIIDLFQRYERAFNDALKGSTDLDAVNALYEPCFIAAAPAGVMTGRKGAEFDRAMIAGFDHYRRIGTCGMEVLDVQAEPIDDIHALARVHWRATYHMAGKRKAIAFSNAYLVRIERDRATVFGWITGDEDAELRKHGIIG